MASSTYDIQIDKAEDILGHKFSNRSLIQTAITHPSAAEIDTVKYSYERLEFLGDAVLGVIVVKAAYLAYEDLDEGGLTRIKVSLVSGQTLSKVASSLNFESFIIFGSSETGTGKRGLHSALENVYEACVAALYLDGGIDVATKFVDETLIPHMSRELALKPENPKSMLQEKLQANGYTPTYNLLKTEGPPHDRTFYVQVCVDDLKMGKGNGKSKKEAEMHAAKATLKNIDKYIQKIVKMKSDKPKSAFAFASDFFKRGSQKQNNTRD